jgi:hypothetical protein
LTNKAYEVHIKKFGEFPKYGKTKDFDDQDLHVPAELFDKYYMRQDMSTIKPNPTFAILLRTPWL